MKRPWYLAGLLVGTLAILTVPLAPAASKGRTPAPAPITQTLTYVEQFCRAAGAYAFNRAVDRDNGHAYTTILAHARQWDRDQGMPKLGAYHEQILLRVFSLPDVTPAYARQWEELRCLKILATDAPEVGTLGTLTHQ
jgi:hypothetical protein